MTRLSLIFIFVHRNNFHFFQFGWKDALLHRYVYDDGERAGNNASGVSSNTNRTRVDKIEEKKKIDIRLIFPIPIDRNR